MARVHFYHTVWKENPTTHVFEPLEGVLATVYPVDNTGVESGTEATVFTGRTGIGVPADMLTDARGVIEFYFAIGDYNVHFSDTDVPARIDPFMVGIAAISGADGSITAAKLAGGITSAQLAGSIAANKLAGSILESQVILASDAAAGTPSRRTLGTGAAQAAPGNDVRFPAGADIVNADISASAAIAGTKLAGGITNAQLAGSITEDKVVSLPTTKLTGTITKAQLIAAVQEALFAPGDIKATAVAAAPSGWLLCDGSAVLRTDYAALYAAIGGIYGITDETHFMIPDLRGRVPVGEDGTAARLTANDSLGLSGGEEKHTLTTAEMPSHLHRWFFQVNGTNAASGGDHEVHPPQNSNEAWEDEKNTSLTGGGLSHNNMQPFQIINWLIKT